ncbi:DUF1273 domain-containing protein [Paenibacillus glycanilyticus]|uniref:DUF1273 domain-containing protein n=1 Tax=Paenibacillus glycanilyticus TaxID=126569 RepID=UPI0020409E77|nr:DUF1273 domain-containing protein [Paenibacillus glycanilyticus]MCM3631637.1 DUF1273 domain-containing protein [Paenibacillus glycanilyticus]
MKTLFATGYRAHELQIFNQKHKHIPFIKKAIEAKLLPLIEEGLEWVITPGQYGFDLWVCEVALELRAEYPQLKLSIITAFMNPEEQWNEEKKEYYQQITSKVDYYGAVSHQPYAGPWQFQARDELLFRKSDGLLLFYDEEAAEGSPRYVKEKALKRHQEDGYELILITAEDIQNAAEEDSYDAYMDPQESMYDEPVE